MLWHTTRLCGSPVAHSLRPQSAGVGHMRMVRDVFHMSGQIVFDHRQSISQILLTQRTPRQRISPGLFALLGSECIAVNLGQNLGT